MEAILSIRTLAECVECGEEVYLRKGEEERMCNDCEFNFHL